MHSVKNIAGVKMLLHLLHSMADNAFIACLVTCCQIDLDGIGVLVWGVPTLMDCLGVPSRMGTEIVVPCDLLMEAKNLLKSTFGHEIV